MSLVQGAHRGHVRNTRCAISVQRTPDCDVVGNAIRDLHNLHSELGTVEANVCCALGKVPFLTSSTYAAAASPMILARLAYCLTKRGILLGRSPAMSWQTRTCASQSGPAPMPTVGMSSSAVIFRASSPGTISRTTPNAPA